jgi:hypothetical protein
MKEQLLMERDKMIEAVNTLKGGKVFGSRNANVFFIIAQRLEQLVVECGWVVNEFNGDAYKSYFYQPFGVSKPWDGRRHVAESAEDAVDTYIRWKKEFADQHTVAEGEAIGSIYHKSGS